MRAHGIISVLVGFFLLLMFYYSSQQNVNSQHLNLNTYNSSLPIPEKTFSREKKQNKTTHLGDMQVNLNLK